MKRMEINKCMGCMSQFRRYPCPDCGYAPGVIISFPIWSYRKNHAPISRWGRMHWEYLKAHKPIQCNCLLLSGKLWISLADLNGQMRDMGCGPHCAVLP